MLGSHSSVHTFGELHFFEQMVDLEALKAEPNWSKAALLNMLERLLTSSREGLFTNVTKGTYTADARGILESANSLNPVDVYKTFLFSETSRENRGVPCEQTPRYLYQAEEILDLFPDAKVICMVRDPRAVLLSQKNKWRRRKLGASSMPAYWAFRAWVNYHPYTMSRMWASASRRARRLNELPRFQAVQFETLVQHPEKTMRELCAFVGLDFQPAMLEVAQIGSSVGTDRPDAFGTDPSRIGSWRDDGLSAGEIALCESVTETELAAWNYDAIGKKNSILAKTGYMVSFAFKSAAALVLNFRRNKNLIQAIRRRLLS